MAKRDAAAPSENHKVTMITRKTAFDWEGLKRKVERDHWRKLVIAIQLREKLHAGKPRQLDAAKAMLAARGLDDVVEAMEATVPDAERAETVVDEGLCEFHRRANKPGLWWPTNNFKACLKENWSVLGYRMDATPRTQRGPVVEADPAAADGKKKPGARKALQGSRGAFAEGVFVVSTDPEDRDWIYLGDKPDGVDQSVSHHIGPKGPQSSIKRNEFMLRPRLVFECWIAVAVAGKIPDESFADMLLHASEHGIGANRSQGLGRFDVVSVDEI